MSAVKEGAKLRPVAVLEAANTNEANSSHADLPLWAMVPKLLYPFFLAPRLPNPIQHNTQKDASTKESSGLTQIFPDWPQSLDPLVKPVLFFYSRCGSRWDFLHDFFFCHRLHHQVLVVVVAVSDVSAVVEFHFLETFSCNCYHITLTPSP